MTAARAIITADSPEWAEVAGRTMTGYATSVIGCDAEASIERTWTPEETPDGRPGRGGAPVRVQPRRPGKGPE